MTLLGNPKSKKSISATVLLLVSLVATTFVSPVQAEELPVEVISSVPLKGTVDIKYTNGTSTISAVYWTGDIPSRVRVLTDSKYQTCFTLKFPVTSSLSYDEITDSSSSLNIWFELWSTAGEKLTYTYLGDGNWNPLGGQTMFAWLECGDWLRVGTYNLIVRTEKTTSTTGLLSRYLKGSQNISFTIDPPTTPMAATTTTSSSLPLVTTVTPNTLSTSVVAPVVIKKVAVYCKRGKVVKRYMRATKTCPKGWKRSR